MGKARKLLLAAIAAVLLTVTLLTWGSIGSVLAALCLIYTVSALLWQKHLNNRDSDDFQADF